SRLARWRFTAGAMGPARRLEARFDALQSRAGAATNGQAVGPTICPSCGDVITSEDGVCPACAAVAPPPPASSLLRLFMFARPRAAMMLLGLLLTVAGNFLGLMPGYLTGPLVKNVLLPWQTGKPLTGYPAWVYLGGMLAAAVVAWQLNWARLFVTSWVSERISAD